MRVFLTVGLLVASQPLLFGAGVLAKWAVACDGGACAGSVHAASPLGAPRDAILTALAAASPYLLAVRVVAVTWLLAGGGAASLAAAMRRSAVPEIHTHLHSSEDARRGRRRDDEPW